MSPLVYLCGALVLANVVTYGTMWVKRERAVSAAYTEGKRVGAEMVATAVSEKSRETVAAADEGRAEVEMPADKAQIAALCDKSASCRDRGKAK